MTFLSSLCTLSRSLSKRSTKLHPSYEKFQHVGISFRALSDGSTIYVQPKGFCSGSHSCYHVSLSENLGSPAVTIEKWNRRCACLDAGEFTHLWTGLTGVACSRAPGTPWAEGVMPTSSDRTS